jgi:hypothetical protein
LTPIQWNLYTHYMEVITRGNCPAVMKGWQDINPSRVIDACLVHATADQKAEPFLKAISKWTEV